MSNSKLKTQNLKLIALVALFVALATLYSVVIPLGEGPDEPGHAGYAFFLARAGRLPDQRRNEVPGEGHQPPLAYALAVPLVAWLPLDQRKIDLPGNRRFTWAGGGELNAVAHGSREYWPWRGAVLAWHLARLVSVALGAATVVFTYLAARAIEYRLPTGPTQATVYNLRSAMPGLAAALVAFNPQFLFVSALLTNDALLTALSAALLWLAIRRPPIDDRRRVVDSAGSRAIAIGAVLGLALITKQSALLLAPIAVLGAIGGDRMPRPIFPWLRRAAVVTIGMLAVALAICGWWYLRNLQLYGDLFGLAVFQREFITGAFDARSPLAWLGALAQLHASFWARFGWMNVPAPGWAIGLCGAIEIAAALGLLRSAVQGQQTTRPGGQELRTPSFLSRYLPFSLSGGRRSPWPLLVLPLLAFAWVVSFALTAGLVAWQGRLLFPALPAIAILLAYGIARVKSKRQKAKPIDFATFYLLPFTLAALAAWLPFGVIRPAYVFQTLPEQTALERIGTPVYGRFGLVGDPGAELRGWRLAGDARAGGAPELTLIWHALGRQNRAWTVFVHLVGAQEQIVAQDNAQPRAGAFPMNQWAVGDWVEDRHTLALPASLAPGVYRLWIGLYDPRTDRRAAMFDQNGKLAGDHVDLGPVRVN